ncbi:MAG: DUF6282 family protein [Spirochaetia bacterium]|jgi:hypothetical protein
MPQNDLSGIYDLHIHSAPDIVPRCVDDVEAALQALDSGMAGILLKSHCTLTSDRATMASKVVTGLRVFGSLTLNETVGGLNVRAVEAALMMNAKEIYMPTLSADNDRKARKLNRGIDIRDGCWKEAVGEILALIKDHDAILATGHLSKDETVALIGWASNQGIRKIVVTHPEHPFINFSAAEQKGLWRKGVFFERCFASTLPHLGDVPLERIAREIQEVGAASSILATDLGIAGYPFPVDGMDRFIAGLKKLGVQEREIDVMTRTNPRYLVEGG